MTRQFLTLDQIDPEIAGKIQSRLMALPHFRWRLVSPLMLWGVGGGGLLSGLTSALITYEKPDSFLGMLAGALVFLLVIACVGATRAARKPVEHRLAAADLRALAQTSGLSRAESAYVDALASLAGAAPVLGESLARELLGQLNELAANAGALETHRGQLVAALGPTPLAELEQERAALAGRLEAAPDAASREAMDRSIALCDGRLAQVRALAPGLARVEAQQEVVYQTLASVASSLRGMSAAPAGPPAIQVEQIRQATTEAVGQTRAVEDAVQEVLAIAAS